MLLGLNKDLLLDVAQTLLLDVYWNDEREAGYHQECVDENKTWVQSLDRRPESPAIPVEEDALIEMAYWSGRIEQAWGRSFWSVARAMFPTEHRAHSLGSNDTKFAKKLNQLVYRTFMACIGHGIGPNDDGGFPSGLKLAPVRFENFMMHQLDYLPD